VECPYEKRMFSPKGFGTLVGKDLLSIFHCVVSTGFGGTRKASTDPWREGALAMMRAHRIELAPRPEQESCFRQACGSARFASNWGLARWNERHAVGEKPNLVEVTKCAPEAAPADLGTAFANPFLDLRRKSGQRAKRQQGRRRDRSDVSNDLCDRGEAHSVPIGEKSVTSHRSDRHRWRPWVRPPSSWERCERPGVRCGAGAQRIQEARSLVHDLWEL